MSVCSPDGNKLASFSPHHWPAAGLRYDAVDRTLYIDSKVGDFTGLLSTETGFGNVGLKKGKPFLKMVYGNLDVKKCIVSGVEKSLSKISGQK